MKFWYYSLLAVVTGIGVYALFSSLPANVQAKAILPLRKLVPNQNIEILVVLIAAIIIGLIVLPVLLRPGLKMKGGIPK